MSAFPLPLDLMRCKKCKGQVHATTGIKRAADGILVVCRHCTRATVPPHSLVEHILEIANKHPVHLVPLRS